VIERCEAVHDQVRILLQVGDWRCASTQLTK